MQSRIRSTRSGCCSGRAPRRTGKGKTVPLFNSNTKWQFIFGCVLIVLVIVAVIVLISASLGPTSKPVETPEPTVEVTPPPTPSPPISAV